MVLPVLALTRRHFAVKNHKVSLLAAHGPHCSDTLEEEATREITTRQDFLSAQKEEGDSMSSQIMGLRVAGTVFGLMSLAQLARLVIRPEVLVGGYALPLWPSALAFGILGGLSAWMWKLTRVPTK